MGSFNISRCFQGLRQQFRTFSFTHARTWKSHDNALADRHAEVPPYPYGPAKWYKQSNKGLYGAQMIRFGNNVGEKSKRRSRRAWHPNLITRNLKSNILGRTVSVKMTTRVLRTVDKIGGIDAYLLGSKPSRIRDLGMEGWKLRCELLSSRAYRRLAVGEQKALRQVSEQKLELADQELGEASSMSAESSSEQHLASS
ncbi:ribosomal protein L28 [Sphaceloma murrayae]|uniref:Large ribosomal subunit protein bL28m n=1 Tax=Sphaceloma murrayae TaxID=2082308 RepID=A0A2K1QPF3_9PEZI|nr:ribosomal protein L28 [Sphaceloma murrayae]